MTTPSYPRIRDMVIFLALDSVPRWLRGGWYRRWCRWQMERWHPDLREDPTWQARWTRG